jgi:multicomponent Na+:H+ antiporter subunit D
MTDWLHPALPFLASAAVAAVAGVAVRRIVLVLAAALSLALAWTAPEGAYEAARLMGQPVVPLRVDALGRAFAIVFALISGLGAVYAAHVDRRRFHVAASVAAAAASGIVLAGDWVTFYLAWETLALASFVLVLDGGTPRATGAGLRYLLVHLLGGSVLLGGLAWQRVAGGDALVGPLAVPGGGLLVLVGIAINAAVPPLHAWLTDAYPESSAAAGVLLSAFATKSAVYALARVFPGTEALVWAGCLMALWGVVFAVLEDDMRRLLGYHIVSQVGYMVAGVGLGTPLALSGAVAHAFCHILYKGLLFMATGSLVHVTGRRRLSALGGLARPLPAVAILYMVGALSISGVPPLNGFVSKPLIIVAAEAAHVEAAAWLLTVASVGTFLSVALKLPALVFGGAAREPVTIRPVPRGMTVAMTLTGALCLLLGVAPGLLYRLMPHPVTYGPYSAAHLSETLELVLGTALVFVLARPLLAAKATETLDLDRVYRAIGRAAVRGGRLVEGAAAALERVAFAGVSRARTSEAVLAGPVGYAVLIALVAVGLFVAFFA